MIPFPAFWRIVPLALSFARHMEFFAFPRKELESYAEGKTTTILLHQLRNTAMACPSYALRFSSLPDGGTSDGRLLFPTLKGVAVVRPEILTFNFKPPPWKLKFWCSYKRKNISRPRMPMVKHSPWKIFKQTHRTRRRISSFLPVKIRDWRSATPPSVSLLLTRCHSQLPT